MIIEFDPDILDSMENYGRFSYLLHMFSLDRRYDLFVDIDQVVNSPVYAILPAADKEMLSHYFNLVIQESKEADYSISNQPNGNPKEYTLEEAGSFFAQPLSIIVEHSQNDKYFLQALVKNFKKRAKKIQRHLDMQWIQIEHGGGSTTEAVIAAKLDNFNGRRHSPSAYLRLFVLADSDAEYPGHDQTQDLRTFLDGENIPYHILAKREMENYMPDELVLDMPGDSQFISAYLQLTSVQKDYFDIQFGFRCSFDNLKPEVQSLFHGISEEDFQTLRDSVFDMPRFKSAFPRYFLDEKVTQNSLKDRAVSINSVNELETILDKITLLL